MLNNALRIIIKWWESKDRVTIYPWRSDSNVYRSIVTEVLLTRTRRDAVAEIYKAFFSAFPDPKSLSSASYDEILKVIKPLGLRKRVHYLKVLGKILSDSPPKTPADLGRLPGIGEYARGILSLKLFGEGGIPADRNIARVLWRFVRGEDPQQEKPEKDSWIKSVLKSLEGSLDPQERLKITYALMDLGYEICKPRRPLCYECPLKKKCRYVRRG